MSGWRKTRLTGGLCCPILGSEDRGTWLSPSYPLFSACRPPHFLQRKVPASANPGLETDLANRTESQASCRSPAFFGKKLDMTPLTTWGKAQTTTMSLSSSVLSLCVVCFRLLLFFPMYNTAPRTMKPQ